jgi:hypothetical protein
MMEHLWKDNHEYKILLIASSPNVIIKRYDIVTLKAGRTQLLLKTRDYVLDLAMYINLYLFVLEHQFLLALGGV